MYLKAFPFKKLTAALLPLSFTAASQASDDVYRLDDVIVTASRTAQTADQALAPVSVISRKDIENSQATNVPDLLKQLPGVQINTNGGPGANTSLFIRGLATSKSLILVDGLRFGSATSGTANLQYLSPDQIERIEVVRGPRASLYGADAMAGVINIITRKGAGKPTATVKLGYGSRNTRVLGTNISGGNDSTRYFLSAGRTLTDGYDRTDDVQSPDGDKDAYRNTAFSLNLGHDFSAALTGQFRLMQNEGTSHFDNSPKPGFDPKTRFREQAASGEVKYSVTDVWVSRLTLGYNKTNDRTTGRADYVSGKELAPSQFATTRNILNWQNDVSVNDSLLLTGGFDYYNDRIHSTTKYQETSRDNKAVFVQAQQNFAHSDLQVALRRDRNQRYGSSNTGNLAYGYNLSDDLRLIASFGTAFKAPGFNDLYWPGFGNPELKPEESKNYELELRGSMERGQWNLSVFQNDIDNLITVQKANIKHKATSIKKARIRGIELTTAYKLADWNIKGSVTLLDPKEIRSQGSDRVLIKRSKYSASLNLNRRFGEFTFGADVLARSKTFSYSGNKRQTQTNGFTTFNLYGDWQATKEVKAGLKVVNLLNKKYQTAKGYNEEPRGIFATVTWSPAI